MRDGTGRRGSSCRVADAKKERLSLPWASTSARAILRSPTVWATACAERTEPEVESDEAADDGQAEERIAGARRELDPAQLRPAGERAHPRERGAEPQQRPDARRVAGNLEAAAPANERREQEERDRRLLEVQALREVRCGGSDDDRDGELPGAPPPFGERAGEPDQADAEGDGQRPAPLPADRAAARPG